MIFNKNIFKKEDNNNTGFKSLKELIDYLDAKNKNWRVYINAQHYWELRVGTLTIAKKDEEAKE